jgi:hypothetical protein|nr:MAG TPA: hypothetical protein [Caudoviricetes sp.]
MLNWQSWSNFVLEGGTTGNILYLPNVKMADIEGNKFDYIGFSPNYNVNGSYTEGTEVGLSIQETTTDLLAYNGQKSPAHDDNVKGVVILPGGYTVYYGKSSGGFAAHGAGNYYCSGSYGSQNASELTGSQADQYMQPAGAPGGDGTFGFKCSYEVNFASPRTNPITSTKTIPISSIFGGTSKGKAGYINTNGGQRTGASVYGGAGYGDSWEGVVEGVRKAGYGSGQMSSPADEDAGNLILPGDGIVCLYYHNEPI